MTSLGKALVAILAVLIIGSGIVYFVRQNRPAVQVPNTNTVQQLPPTTSPQRIKAKINQGASALGIQVTPLEVVQDSRCPIDVQCIQAGTVQLKALVKSDTEESTVIFTLNKMLEAGGAQITLDTVEPPKQSTITINPSDYQFFFEISK